LGEIKEIKFEEPPQRDMGDLATSVAFQLARKLKKIQLRLLKN
jgi:arginyl-tRNA synthetase